MNAQPSGRRLRGKLATVLAACGALTMSSGLALVVSTAPAHADAAKICHANNTDDKPYTWSAKPSTDSGTHHWVNDGWWNDVFHHAGDIKLDLTDVTQAQCESPNEPGLRSVAPQVSFTDPTCDGVQAAVDTTPVAGVTYTVAGTAAAGQTVTVSATLADGYSLAQGATTTFTHTFADPSCQQQPSVTPVTPAVTFTDPTCTGGQAGWAGTPMDGVTYAVTGGSVAAGQTVTVSATLADTYALADGAMATFEHTFANPQCDQEPGTNDPGTTDPGTTDPGTTDPGTTDPGTTDPGTTDPGTTDPGTTDPGTTDPGTTDPGTTDPGTTDPGRQDHSVSAVGHHAKTESPTRDAHVKAAPRHAAAATAVVTPTVVHAGLPGLPTHQRGADVQTVGLAMSTGGAVVLLSAGWLGLGLRRRDARTS